MRQHSLAEEGEPDEGTLLFSSSAGRFVLAVAVAGSAMAMIDSTVVSIALPVIGRDFHASVATLQWLVTAYLTSLAGLLLLGGSLADRFGRRRVFLIGVIWFALASLCCGLSPNASVLISARALQGVGGALLTPGSLAILEASFVPKDRGRAIGAWAALGSASAAVGPLLGGYLISALSWRYIFFINLPIAALVVALGLRHVPESIDPKAARQLDLPGAILVSCGLIGLTYGIVEGPSIGWSAPATDAALGIGLGLLGIFVRVEQRSTAPLLAPSLFSSRQFSAANLVTFVVYGALGGVFFLLPVDLEQVARYTPIEAGLAFSPATALMLIFAARSGALASKIGPRLQMSLGPIAIGGAFVLLTRVTASGNYLSQLLPAALVFGTGIVITVAPLTATVLAAAPLENAGVASAINNDVARAASLLSVASLPALIGLKGAAYLHPGVLSEDFHRAMWICALACGLAGLISATLISNNARLASIPEHEVKKITLHR